MASGKLLFRLTPTALVCANTGVPFTREGVISICAAHLGPKHALQPVDNYECRDGDLVCLIRERELSTYRNDRNRITSDFRGEEETRQDYGGRAIWELMQNADDATAANPEDVGALIGTKGLGFKSVLEFSSRPQIFSGPFNFEFNSERTQELLLAELGLNDVPPLSFRIPHAANPDDEIRALVEQGYTTIVRLPLRDGVHSVLRQRLTEFDYRVLLFCQNLHSVRIEVDEGTACDFSVEGSAGFVNGEVQIRINENGLTQQVTYRRWVRTEKSVEGKHHSAAICLPLSSEGPVAEEQTGPLYVFFPTNEPSPFRAVLHASFDLEQNRKHVRGGEHTERAVNLLMDCLQDALSSVPAWVALKAFVPRAEPDTPIAKELKERFDKVLCNCEFISVIGGGMARAGEAISWKYSLGDVLDGQAEVVRAGKLVAPRVMKECAAELGRLGVRLLGLKEYPKYLKECRRGSVDECRASFHVLRTVTQQTHQLDNDGKRDFLGACRIVPCWRTEKGEVRALVGKQLFRKRGSADDLPEWFEFDVLEASFAEEAEKFEKEDSKSWPRNWTELCDGLLLDWKPDHLLHRALVPQLRAHQDSGWWGTHGTEALLLGLRWYEADSKPIVPVLAMDQKRRELAAVLNVPTDKGWLPAQQAYAGSAWGGPESFDTYFQKVPDRAILAAPDDKRWSEIKDFEKWKSLLRYAGVSWEPKLHFDRSKKFDGNPPKGWEQYARVVLNELPVAADVYGQWIIEHWPDSLAGEKDGALIVRPLAEAILGLTTRTEFRCKYSYTRRRTKKEDLCESFAQFQLRNLQWLPCKPGLLHLDELAAPCDTWMPRKGISGLLSEVSINIPDGEDGRNLGTYLTQVLGVGEEPPKHNAPEWAKWMREFSEIAGKHAQSEQIQRVAEDLYRKVADLWEKPPHLETVAKVPCHVFNGERELVEFRDRRDARWLDEPWLAIPNVRRELLKHGQQIFLQELGAGSKLANWLGIERLSRKLRHDPKHDGEDAAQSQEITERYRNRYPALCAALSDHANLPKKETAFIVVRNLRMVILSGGERLEAPIDYWKEKYWINAGSTKWHGMGALVSAVSKGWRNNADTIENILRAEDDKEVLRRLRELGVAESALRAVERELVSEPIEPIEEPKPTGETDVTQPTQGDGKASDESQPIIDDEEQENRSRIKPQPRQREGTVPPTNAGYEEIRDKKWRDAQEWLRTALKGELEKDGWEVSESPEQDEIGRESDIVIRRDGREAHVEVKHVRSGYFYWSKREVDKAKDCEAQGNYWLALVTDESDWQEYRVCWLFNPLRELVSLWRDGKIRVEYTWKTTVPVDSEQPWEILNVPPAGEPNNFSFKVPYEPRTNDSAQIEWNDEIKKRLRTLPEKSVDGRG